MQTPPWQVDGATHVVPQPPQLAGLVRVSTQLPAQFVKGAAQAQAPPTQARLPPQFSPQNPQLALLVSRFTQFAPQRVSPDRHWITHWLSEQRGVAAGHACPQAPQLALLEVRS